MSGAVLLAFRHARHHSARTALLVLCVACSLLLPLVTRRVMEDFRRGLTARAAATPLVIGAKGNRFDLTMSALYFRRAELGTVTTGEFERLRGGIAGLAIPLNLRFTAQGRPVVATTADYFEFRGLSPGAGALPRMIGECVLGARAAAELGLGPGGAVFSDPSQLYDIARPPALKMRVVGVLRASGTADDEAVFTDLKTAWILEGLSHGHADAATRVPEALVLERSGSGTVVSEELVTYYEVTPENVGTFHVHADAAALPLSAVIVRPASEKEGTILSTRLNAGSALQAAAPARVVEELLAYVVRLRQLLDGVSALLIGFTAVMIGLVTALSIRIRAREIESLVRIGASRGFIRGMFVAELIGILAVGAALAVAGAGIVGGWGGELVKLL